ncbi:MAG: Asp23/Gls24 family envelope stress response protein [Puniceicoccales bacterium]|jgi:uncharacterized alkaline shock family protein YloU|nr:Asp23/Gls24 family envelope stress response protein [Puniceicoccales bacterium]
MAKDIERPEKDTSFSVPMVSDASSCSMGEIKINHSVVANIATLSALQTNGVLGVGKRGFANGIASFFSNKRGTANGVNVSEDEFGNYVIDICVILRFGCELAKVASDIQQNVAEHITKMTNTSVSKVNVIIDGVETPEEAAKNEITEEEL